MVPVLVLGTEKTVEQRDKRPNQLFIVCRDQGTTQSVGPQYNHGRLFPAAE